jgi:uncharacterized protein
MRIVIYANVHISALAFGGTISKNLIKIYQEEQIQVYTSKPIFEELQEKLSIPKFDKITKVKIDQDEINEYLNNYKQETIFGESSIIVNICRDPDDNMFLELALEIQADYIITGDKDLLSISQFQSTKICNISDFIKDNDL